MEQVFNPNFFIEQDVKPPWTEYVRSRIKDKSCNKENRIDVFQGCDDIPQTDLGKEQSEKNNSYENCKIFCQTFIVHNPRYGFFRIFSWDESLSVFLSR